MDKSISPEIEKRIRALCADIASAEDLNSDLHDELYTHIEEKVMGYLSGEETLSEADAYLLAREHFGDRIEVREQLAEVHPKTVSLIPRLISPIVLLVPLMTLFLFSVDVYMFLPASLYLIQFIGVCAGMVWIQFRLLQVSREREQEGKKLWMQGWKLRIVVPVLVIVVMVLGLFLNLIHMLLFTNYGLVSEPIRGWEFVRFVAQAWILFTAVGSIWAWMKHCDDQMASRWHLLRVVIAFSLVIGLYMSCATFFRVISSVDSIEGVKLIEFGTWELIIRNFSQVTSRGLEMMMVSFVIGSGTWLVYMYWTRKRSASGKLGQVQMAKR